MFLNRGNMSLYKKMLTWSDKQVVVCWAVKPILTEKSISTQGSPSHYNLSFSVFLLMNRCLCFCLMSTCTVRSILNLIINTMLRFLLLENPYFLPQQIIKIIMKNYSEIYEICKPISDINSQYSKSVLITPFTAYTILK